MDTFVKKFKKHFSSWDFVGAFEQSFDPGLSQTEIQSLYFIVCKSLTAEPIFERLYMHHVPSFLEKPSDTFNPTKVLQPVPEL